MSEETPFSAPDHGLGMGLSRGGGDSAVSDLAFRAREVWRLFTGDSGEVYPDGRWIQETDAPSRKVWSGYRRRVHLETEISPGGGWRVWMELPSGSVQYPIRVRHVVPERSGEVTRSDYLEIRHASDPAHVPTFPRTEAFTAAELFMSGYAMKRPAADAVDQLETEGDPDE